MHVNVKQVLLVLHVIKFVQMDSLELVACNNAFVKMELNVMLNLVHVNVKPVGMEHIGES